MTEAYIHGPIAGVRIKVIGQPDLDADWRPVPGKPMPRYGHKMDVRS